MARNVSGKDAWVRMTVTVGLVGLAGVFYERSTFVAIALLAAGILATTALSGWCPVYAALGIRTRKEGKAVGR